MKDRHFKEPRQALDDGSVATAKKSKFSMAKDTGYTSDGSSCYLQVTNIYLFSYFSLFTKVGLYFYI